MGLGNPGPQYETTRHNAGAWFVQHIAEQANASLRPETKFQGLAGKINLDGRECRLLLPTTFMNHSGRALIAIAKFFKIEPQAILVAHDELDMPAGQVKLKQQGGHGGHNGLRDIITHLGSKDFLRLRLGIGHPGHKDAVLNYVLGKPSQADRDNINHAIDAASHVLNLLLEGDIQKAILQLHSTPN